MPTAAAVSSDDPRFSAIGERVQGWVDQGYYPGAALLIARGDQVLYERCFGGYTPDTVVYIASAGKWLAAATIMSVVDEGKLSLDDPAGKWVPELEQFHRGYKQERDEQRGSSFKNGHTSLNVAARSNGRNTRKGTLGAATLRQLLSHTSGYPPYQASEVPKDDYQSLTESVTHIAPLAPHYPPGKHFEYGGLAFQVAGRMAEKATGEQWETLFEERIARPLGMTRTRFTPVDAGEGHSPMLAGGARSTLHDYAAFLSMIAHDGAFHGKRVLSMSAVRAMEADQTRGAAIPEGNFVQEVRGGTRQDIYGLGEWREFADAKGVVVSSPSWAGAYPWVDTRTHTYGVLIAHIQAEKASAAHFSGFLSSPILATMAQTALERP